MPPSSTHLSLAELIGALSHALDITEGQPRGHSQRCCWIGFKLGQAIGFSTEELSDLYYALLLKDLGCSSNAARICQLYLTDDRAFKLDFKSIDGSLPQALRFVLGHTGLSASMAERVRAIVNVLRNGGEISRELIEARCHRGAEIAKLMRFSPAVCGTILCLDEHWDGSGKPEGLDRRNVPQSSQIALLAQVTDVFFMANGRAAAVKEIESRAGTWFDPTLVEVFSALAVDDAFWAGLSAPDLAERVIALEPSDMRRQASETDLDDVALGFAKVIDAKSPHTAGHSERVAVYADIIAEGLGLAVQERRFIRRAALLHDIGKLGISNTILDKPSKLTDAEQAEMRKHPIYSSDILSGVPAFRALADVALCHHEKLDGTGYPRGLRGNQISLHTRIVSVADVFDAITAHRPYRGPVRASQAFTIMSQDVGTALDAECFQTLQRALGAAAEAA